MTIKVWVIVKDDEIAGDEIVLAALPPIGARLDIRDRNGDKRVVTVRQIEMFGMRATDHAKVKPVGGQLEVSLYCDE